jgi:peptide/nickel transport system permease protein
LWLKYVARRLFHSLFLLFAVASLSFALLELTPGSLFDELRLDPRISPETIAALQHSYGLDQPATTRYLLWLESLAHGDLGISLTYRMPAAQLLIPRAQKTLILTIPALLLAWGLALPLGLWSAIRAGGPTDRTLLALSFLLLCLPEVILASTLLLFAIRTGWLTHPFPAALTILTAGLFPILYRHIRAALTDASQATCIAHSRAIGVRPARMWFRHILPLAANPLISLLGLSIAGLLSSSLVVESLLGWPGLGPLFLDAVASRDPFLIYGTVLLSTGFLIAGNLLADLLLYATDPRL